MKTSRRLVVNDDPDFVEKFLALLRAHGMTFSGWLRRTARQWYNEHKDDL